MGVQKCNRTIAATKLARWNGSNLYRVPALIGAIVAASTAITGVTEAETAFDQAVSVPANLLEAGSCLRIRAQGIYTATTGSETHSLIVKVGATTIVTLASVDPANNDIFYFDLLVQIRTAGASGTCVATGTVLAQAQTAVGTAKPVFLASTAIDTTVANSVAVYIDRQASATDSDSARLDILTVELV